MQQSSGRIRWILIKRKSIDNFLIFLHKLKAFHFLLIPFAFYKLWKIFINIETD